MLIKIIRKSFSKNLKIDILSTSEIKLDSTKNITEINIKNYQNKKITAKKINLKKIDFQKEDEINLFNIDPSRYLAKIELLYSQIDSKITKSKIIPEINIINLKKLNSSLLNSSEILFFLNNHISQEENIPINKLNEIITKELLTKKNEILDSKINNLFFTEFLLKNENGLICLAGMPEALLRYNVCKNVTKKNLINGFKKNVFEIRGLFEQKKLVFGKNFIQPLDLIKKNMNLKMNFFGVNFILEFAKEILKTEDKNVNIYLDDMDFQIISDLLHLKNYFFQNDRDEENDSLYELRKMDENEQNILFKNSFINILGEKSYKKYLVEKNKNKELSYLFSDIGIESYLKNSILKLNEYDSSENFKEKHVQDLIIKMAFLDVFLDNKLLNSEFINQEFFYISNKYLSKEDLIDLKKKFFFALKIFENIKKSSLENFEFNDFLSEDKINKEFEKILIN